MRGGGVNVISVVDGGGGGEGPHLNCSVLLM